MMCGLDMARDSDLVAGLQAVTEEVRRVTERSVLLTNKRILRAREVMAKTADLIARSQHVWRQQQLRSGNGRRVDPET
jgi:hypothetical protein